KSAAGNSGFTLVARTGSRPRSGEMRGYLKDHVGVFEPDEVVILLAAFDKSWGAVQASGAEYPSDKLEFVRAMLARNIIAAQWKASATWAGCATVLYSPWLNQICEAGRRANSERRRKRSSGDPALPGADAVWGSSCGCWKFPLSPLGGRCVAVAPLGAAR